MADSATPIELIVDHKENIQPITSGRSARALAASLSPLSQNPHSIRSEHLVRQSEFEQELKTAAELDDPLEVWVRYVNWTIEAFPSGHSNESGLVPLLERATAEFLNEPQYKNDPRYLKLWIHYISNFSDAPREVFAYLNHHEIGQRLALFYEEYAAFMEGLGRRNQAAEIYQRGIENKARPVERLQRKFEDFMKRIEALPPVDDDPSSPALPAVRPALAVRPFGGSAGGGLGGAAPTQQPTQQQTKLARQKMTIFSDADNPGVASASAAEKESGGWERIGTLGHRKKENMHKPEPWAGQILKQEGPSKPPGEKLMIFKDPSLLERKHTVSQTTLSQNRRPERVAVNLELVYPEEDEEYCFEELQAIKRGLYGVDWDEQREAEAEAEAEAKAKAEAQAQAMRARERGKMPAIEGSRTPVKVKTVLSPSPNREKIRRKGKVSASPTMTFHTRAATDEIYSMFNQPLKKPSGDIGSLGGGEDSEDDSDVSDGEDYTTTTQVERADDSDRDESDGEDDTMTQVERADDSDSGESDEDDTIVTQVERMDDPDHGQEDGSEDGGDGDDDTSVKSDWSDFTMHKGSVPDAAADVTAVLVEETTSLGQEEIEAVKRGQQLQQTTEGMQKLQIFTDKPASSEIPASPEQQARKIEIPPPPEDFDPPTLPYHAAKEQALAQNRLPYMTPIVERTESLPPTTARQHTKTPSRTKNSDHNLSSSPIDEESPELRTPPPPQPDLKGNRKRVPLGVKKEVPVQKGPIIHDLLCNPMDEVVRSLVFEKMQPPLKSYQGYYEFPQTNSARASEIKKFTKAVKKDADKSSSNLLRAPVLEFVTGDGGSSYVIKKELGKGAFAPVYLVENTAVADAEDEVEDADTGDEGSLMTIRKKTAGRKRLEAIKMEDPPSPWEFYIIRQAKRRLGVSRAAESIIQPHEMHFFADEVFLVLEYRGQGTVLDLVNVAKSEAANGAGAAGGLMDEVLVMFLTIELFRTIEALHSKGIIHGDLKADNCLIRFDPTTDAEWASRYTRDGSGGWNKKGISLIDFGRGVDMKVFEPNVQFVADWKTDQQDCAEMREMRPWTYQIDYHGLAATVHSMLFGKYIETVGERGSLVGGGTKHYRITSTFKRYWQQDIWTQVFELLLNPLQHVEAEETHAIPVNRGLRTCRERMEEWLEANCERGVGLRSMIRRMESLVSGKRR